MARLITIVLFAVFMVPLSHAQVQETGEQYSLPGASTQFPRPAIGSDQDRPRDEAEEKMEHEREKKLNEQRQADLKRDTDKLLLLATQLKQAVDKSNEHTLSLDVIKKAGEIEKLAKSVRQKMRGQN